MTNASVTNFAGRQAGVPLYPQPGRGGGWRLVGGARTNLTGLTEAETHALFTLIGQWIKVLT